MTTTLTPRAPMAGDRRRRTWSTATLVVAAGPITFLLTSLVSEALQRHYDPVTETVSDLGALTADHGGIITVGFLATAVSVAVLAVLARRAFRGGRSGLALPITLGIVAVGTAVAGLAREDCSSASAACRALEDAGKLSGHHGLHNLVALPVFLGMALAPALAARRFRLEPRWRSLVGPSRAVAIATFAGMVVMVVTSLPAAGLLERVVMTLAYGWMVAFAARCTG